ncbi:hypothetical protein [uncultured Rothia sp.]|uniref:hypothetical protein n=1 Tax=uncultured Rothia sp. TaxID=316088 RepID=UPI003216FD8B
MAQKTWETVGFSKPNDGMGGARALGSFHISYRTGDKEQRKNSIARAAQIVLNTPSPLMVDHNAQQVFKHCAGSLLEHVATYATEPYDPPALEIAPDLFEQVTA